MDNIKADDELKKRNQLAEIWRRFRKNKAALAGLIVIVILALFAVFADFLADYERDVIGMNSSIRLNPPSAEHIFGTDSYGRDVFARLVFGARVSLSIGIICISISIVGGVFIGCLSGYIGGLFDTVVMRIMEMFSCIPGVLLALAIVAALGQGMRNLVIAMIIALIPGFARIIRALILPIIDQEYVEAARACGTRTGRIILRHILPNAMGPIIVQATMAVSSVIISAAGLSFIGMGVQPPDPEWGAMLSQGNEFIIRAPYLVIFPGLAIVISALSFNLVGDGLRDALDPRLRD
jgi:peptide/nickel transport system permease protein